MKTLHRNLDCPKIWISRNSNNMNFPGSATITKQGNRTLQGLSQATAIV